MQNRTLNKTRTTVDGVIGAGVGAALVLLFVTLDLLGIASMVRQIEQETLFLALMVFKPALVLGAAALGLSVWRQLGESAEKVTYASRFPTAIVRLVPAFARRG